ncbi:MAG: 30S ribosomal protein S16 [Chlamydiia bacterium]|nr:30S ribosomal protein S16 [Chlamydiia bacterium]MCH9615950.1 30S ribosomal protein S16 [Chlamydiia bacterium]MCH9628647.1 30S ribosomal protein S16 [Chlamydiia bacterium]
MDSRTPRDGKYLEMVGSYDPHNEGEKELKVLEDRIAYWLGKGAQLSEKAEALVKRAAPGALKAPAK